MTNKWTATDQVIAFDGRTYVIPQGTRISINGTGIHFNPKVWGENATEWQPSRWIVEDGDRDAPLVTPSSSRPATPKVSPPASPKSNVFLPSATHLSVPRPSVSRASSTATVSPTTSAQGILRPAKGAFLPFSDGARACSGKKFATVEFVAVLFTLLRDHRVQLEDGWTAERVKKILSGRKAGGLTLQPPESIPLRYVRR